MEFSDTLVSDKIQISSLSSSDSLANEIKAHADLSFSGWGAEVQADMAMSDIKNVSHNNVVF